MKPLKVSCDRCLFVFELKSNMCHRGVAGSVEDTVITCPNCGLQTLAVRTTLEIRALQAKVQKERKRAEKKLRNGVPLSKAERKLRQAKRDLKETMDKVNGRA